MIRRIFENNTPIKEKKDRFLEQKLQEASKDNYERLKQMGIEEFDWVKPSSLHESVKSAIKLDRRILVIGDSGWGKTDTVRKIGKELGWPVKDFSLSFTTPEDIGGIPQKTIWRNGKEVITNLTYSWVQNILDIYEEGGTAAFDEENRDIEYEAGTPTIIFLDELNHAPPSLLNACYRIIQSKKIGDFPLDKACRIVAAMNFKDENITTEDLSGPLIKRFQRRFIAPTEWKTAVDILSADYPQHEDFIRAHIADWHELKNPRAVSFLMQDITDGADIDDLPLKEGNLKQDIARYIMSLKRGEEIPDDKSDLSAINSKVNKLRDIFEKEFISTADSEFFVVKQPFDDKIIEILKRELGVDDEMIELALEGDI